ncbi:MAG: 50S ribosomal protein L30 [Deinococcus sp.]
MKVTLKKSTIGYNKEQAQTVKALGLRRIGDSRELPDTPAILGMVRKVSHLLEVSECSCTL